MMVFEGADAPLRRPTITSSRQDDNKGGGKDRWKEGLAPLLVTPLLPGQDKMITREGGIMISEGADAPLRHPTITSPRQDDNKGRGNHGFRRG